MKTGKKLLALMLCIIMCISFFPVSAAYAEEGEAHEHAYTEVVTAPTCTEQGYTTHTCECGDSYVDTYTDALGHQPVDVAEVPATTEASGTTAGKKCAVCGEVLEGCVEIPVLTVADEPEESVNEEPEGKTQEVVPENTGVQQNDQTEQAHIHTYTETVTAPTCTEKGYTTHACECGDSYVDSYTDALGHQPVDVAEVPATEEATGVTAGKKCAVCGEVLEGCEEIPQLEKTVITITKQPKDTAPVAGKVEFTVEATVNKDVELQYQWQRLDESVEYADDAAREAAWEDIENEIGTSLIITELESETALAYKQYSFRCYITSGEAAAATDRVSILPLLAIGTAKSTIEAKDGVVASGDCGDNLEWKLDEDGILTISGTGEMKTFEIYGSWVITPWSGKKFNTVIIEDGVTSISNGFFNADNKSNNYGISVVSLPESITTISNDAFRGCSSLTSINFPNSLNSIGSNAFLDCSSLTSINLPNSLTSIGSKAFSGCSNLNNTDLPEGITKISSGTFSNCISLTSMTIPASVKIIWSDAFSGCNNITNIDLPE
ncbi:MAG: leucine-rich repeat domain-containing protein, partial [Oscillospiraceae bacterium]|nr:leucine-rich repeat domain-containing protein [Oscillospiraceae bacterium]